MRVGIIGLGTMGKALFDGIQGAFPGVSISGTTRSSQAAANAALVRDADVVILCVKPQQARAIVEELAPSLPATALLVSIVASVTVADLEAWSGSRCAIVRAMPNTPCLVGAGMTALCASPKTDAKFLATARSLFEPLGKSVIVEESLMDGVTGLSGCGPAYVYLIIEALSEAGVKLGLPRTTSTLLAAQTLLGAAKMVLDRGEHPAALKDEVTTPAGCTIDGLMVLEEGKLRSTLISGVIAAATRSKTLRLGDGK